MRSRTFYSALVQTIAPMHGLSSDLVEALIIQESNGKAHAYRFEPQFYARYLAKKPEYAGQNPERISASYGLMQIMYTTAKELGFAGEPEELFVPTTNLQWGCRKLATLFDWSHGNVASALAAYNGGKADNEPGHRPALRNAGYAAAVLAVLRQLTPLRG